MLNGGRRVSVDTTQKQSVSLNGRQSITELGVICIMAGQCVKQTWQPCGLSTSLSEPAAIGQNRAVLKWVTV
jgi:hypothetical protein